MRKHAIIIALLLALACTSCTVYPRTHAGYTTKYGTANVPRRDKENRH